MNTKAIALFAVLAVALTGGFAIAGADAADGDDFTAEYWTEGPFEGVDATFETGLATQLTWWGSIYGDEGAIADHAIVTVAGKLASFMWNAIPLEAGTYHVEIYNTAKTIVYEGSVVVPQTFTVTFAVDDSVVKTLTVDDGDYIAADQLPEDPVKGGQEFVGWALEGATVPFDFVDTPITQDYDFKALFKAKEYTIAVDSAIQNGNVTPSKAVATMGETITLTVTPAEGYQAVSVTVDGVAIEGNTFEMPAKDVTVSATFEPKEYTITIDSAIVNGTVIPVKEKATAGQTVTLTVTPAEGYQTVSVTVDGEAIEGSTFEMPAKDVTVSATFEPKDYTITVDPEIQNGTVTPSKLKAKAGEAISLTVLPEEGYQVASVTLDGAALEEYAFTMPAKDVTVSATFEAKEYTITVDPAIVNGTVVADKERAKAGETVTLTVTADEGYQIASVTVDGKEIEESSFTMPAKNVTVSATFELIPVVKEYTITIDPEIRNGTVTADKEKAKAGETVTLTVTPAEGFIAAAVTVNGETIEGASFEMPASDVIVSAAFIEIPIIEKHAIAVDTEMVGGDVTPDKYLVAAGATVTLSYTEDEGYTFVSYYAYTRSTETPITVSDDGTFTMPAEDVIVGAYFLPDVPVEKYTVTVLPSENGTASADVAEAEEGDLITITATPDDGYQTAAIYVDGKPLLEKENTFSMPARDVEVSVVFAEIPVGGCTVTYVDVNGVIETKSYEIGEEVVYHVTTVPEGMLLGYVNFEPDMYFLIDYDAVEFTAVEGNYTAMISYIALFTVTVLDQDGKEIDEHDYLADEPVAIYSEILGAEIESATSEPEIEDFVCKDGVITFTMPAQDVTVTVTLKPIVPDTVKVVFIDSITEEEVATKTVIAGAYLTEIPNEPVHEGMTFTGWYREGSDVPYDFETMPVMENMTLYADYVETPVIAVSVTFVVDGEEIGVSSTEIGGYLTTVPEAPVKEGFNFVGWCVNDIPTAIDFATTPIFDDMTVYATYIETPDIGEGFAILYHDMYKGKPVDIWWKGYASKDDRVMLANGMDATAIFMGWLAEDQETLFSWNAAYDLNDIERNDCLIYPASYGYPGTDRIYELNAIYALEIEWVSFDGETVLKTDEVIRGEYLDAPFDDETMQEMLDDYKPSDEGYSYTWAGWNVPGVGTYTSEDVEFIKANGSWRIVATYEGKVNEYDITFIWHDDKETITVAYGETPEIENPPAYEDDNFTYTFAGWDPEVTEVTGDATYIATYDKTSKTKDVTITVNDFAYGYFTYNDEKQTADYILKVPMDAEAPVIDGNVLTFDFVRYEGGDEVPETHVFTAFPNPDDTMHYEFVEWTVSEDGNTYTANFVTDIITSKDLDRIQTFFDYTDDEDGDFIFTMKSKDGLAIPKGKLVVKFYEYAYVEEVDAYVQIEDSFDAIEMDWGTYYGDNLISMTIEYADLMQDGAPVDLTTKNINTMWLVFDGYNEAHCESNKATPGQ